MSERLPHIVITLQNGDRHVFTNEARIRIDQAAVYIYKAIDNKRLPAKVFCLNYIRDITFYQNGRSV